MRLSLPKKLRAPYCKQAVLVYASLVVGAALTVFCAIKLWDWYATTHQLEIPSPSTTVTHSDDTPNETKIDTATHPYTVPADQPRLLEIPAISARSFIQRVGVDQRGAVATPSNIHMAGWYAGSAKPGDKGVSIIDGHVRGRYAPGVFQDLKKVKRGDTIVVTYGNGKRLAFTVQRVSRYDTVEAASHMFEKLPSVDTQLVLITCDGVFDKTTAMYSQRVLVYAGQQ